MHKRFHRSVCGTKERQPWTEVLEDQGSDLQLHTFGQGTDGTLCHGVFLHFWIHLMANIGTMGDLPHTTMIGA